MGLSSQSDHLTESVPSRDPRGFCSAFLLCYELVTCLEINRMSQVDLKFIQDYPKLIPEKLLHPHLNLSKHGILSPIFSSLKFPSQISHSDFSLICSTFHSDFPLILPSQIFLSDYPLRYLTQTSSLRLRLVTRTRCRCCWLRHQKADPSSTFSHR